MPHNEIIKVDNLCFSYEEESPPLFPPLSFSLQKGTITLLKGPSGSGKSTILRCINGLYPRGHVESKLDGEITVFGKKVEDYPPGELAKHVGMVFQNPRHQWCMRTIREEVAFGLENIGIPREEMDLKIDEVLRLVGLTPFGNTLIDQLSGGYQQRLALACVLVMEPSILLLDEPTSQLDPYTRKKWIDLLLHLKNTLDLTILVVEHNTRDWLPISDQVISIGQQSPDSQVTFSPSLRKRSIGDEIIRLERVDFRYHKKAPLRIKDISASAKKGERIAIIGANGSGKSTVLSLLAGLRRPTKGDCYLELKGYQKWKETILHERLGFVFQNPDWQFVEDTVLEDALVSVATNPTLVEKGKEYLKNFGLGEMFYHHPLSLSEGQKKRLSVLTAILPNPTVLLLDEPTFGQDANTTAILWKTLEEYTEAGGTLICVTHDMEWVDAFFDRVWLIDQGSVIFNGAPRQLWKHKDLVEKCHLLPPKEKKDGDYHAELFVPC
ncbi:ABC transporter ATP-binding protein [Mangrovibacillus cuniculi]|uniref:ABC transporter ATP-binding protein n=1 Tax=Mangrovibacillus cuniculi TaxID=2593652 RepID=A0A7S8C8S9_9BACI|nr:ABC transporter ATP-binding protein [Mangrovibacillus cuniculi]QPC45520.1 ABC transporter ATP-binding protein [Mangrovibacillus cuniculi]